MAAFEIEKVFVHPIFKENSPLLGYARIQIGGGLFISDLRIYRDSQDPDSIYISFPTREGHEGENRKVIYPVTNEARERITQAITEQYKLESER